ncbi:MAG: energy transducer TonB [Bacteroidota bacterium]
MNRVVSVITFALLSCALCSSAISQSGLPVNVDSIRSKPYMKEKSDYDNLLEAILADVPPEAINMKSIQKAIGYPPQARYANIEGSVIIRLLINEKGKYMSHKVLESSSVILLSAVEEHIKRLKFKPAIKDGKPIPFWINIPFNFSLVDPPKKQKKKQERN